MSSSYNRRSVSPSARFCSDPTCVNISSAGSFRFPSSPCRPITLNKNSTRKPVSNTKKTCMCSPTMHPGSFRCSLHKNVSRRYPTYNLFSWLYAKRLAMTNSLVRIGTVEEDLVRHALATLIRPSSHQQQRRDNFHPRPSRLSVMSMAEK